MTPPTTPLAEPGDHLPWLEHDGFQARVRDCLTRRLEEAAHPSRFINDLHAAHLRCSEAARALRRLIERAPRIATWVGEAVQQHLGLAPETVLFLEPDAPDAPRLSASALEWALRLMRQPPGDETAPEGTRARLLALDLRTQVQAATDQYWAQLADGARHSRTAQWRALYRSLLADKAFIAHQLYELSETGFDLVQRLLDAPTPEDRALAGGPWAQVQVRELVWAGEGQARVAIGGALHIAYAPGAEHSQQVVYVPGLTREFHEFASLAELEFKLPALLNGHDQARLWQRLPLRWRTDLLDARFRQPMPFSFTPVALIAGDAVGDSASSLLHLQRDNELACALGIDLAWLSIRGDTPPEQGLAPLIAHVEADRSAGVGCPNLRRALERLLGWDEQRRAPEISFDALAASLAVRTREHAVRRYENGLLGLLDSADPAAETEAFSQWVVLQEHWQARVTQLHDYIEQQVARFDQRPFWNEKAKAGHSHAVLHLVLQRQALRDEMRLQQRLNLIDSAALDLLSEVLDESFATRRPASDTRALHISVGQPLCQLTGAFVVTTAQALADHSVGQPVLLYVGGGQGGLTPFASLAQLSSALDASLNSPDGSVLWDCIGRHERAGVRVQVAALGAGRKLEVAYGVIEEQVLGYSFKGLVKGFFKTLKWLDEGGQPFSEVSDASLALGLLRRELAERLAAPSSAARDVALVNVRLLRLAAEHRKTLAPWFAGADAATRRRYRHLLQHYLANAQALEHELLERLPGFDTYARAALLARLTRDGLYPGLDIDQPLFDMPDDVSRPWQSHPQSPAGDSGPVERVSQERTTYSLLQLAVHNLDPAAPWTLWRLNHTVYLDPAWKTRLSPAYLIDTLSDLNLSGRYERLIEQAFYGDGTAAAGEPLVKALLQRVLKQRAQVELYSAREQGLSANAQSLFTTALAARTAADLERNGHRLQLAFIHLAGATSQKARHVAEVLLIHDQVSSVWVLYWPGVQGHPAITAHASEQEALQALMQRCAAPPYVTELAQRVAAGWEAQAIESYPGTVRTVAPPLAWDQELEQLRRLLFPNHLDRMWMVAKSTSLWLNDVNVFPVVTLQDIENEIAKQRANAPGQWLGVTPTSGHDVLQVLAHAQVLKRQRRVRASGNSAQALDEYREWRLDEQSAARVRGLLGLVPILGSLVQVYELLLAIRRLYHSGNAHDGVDVVYLALMVAVDLALILYPPAKAGTAAKLRPAPALSLLRKRQALHNQGHSSLAVPTRAKPLPGLQRYQKSLDAEGAIVLRGPFDKGTQVKHGQQFLVDGDARYPVYRRKGEPFVRLRKTDASSADELILYIDEPGERLLGADAPEPQPGSSRAATRQATPGWRPWDSPTTGTEWRMPAQPPVLRVWLQPPLASTHWHAWGLTLADNPPHEVLPARQLFRVMGRRPYDAVKIGEYYYEVLPNGSKIPEKTLFLRRTETTSGNAINDLSRWLGRDTAQQAIPMTFESNGQWQARTPLFTSTISDSVRGAFPGITRLSGRFAAERLIEQADYGRLSTATRLLNLRDTLDRWQASMVAGTAQTDDLLRLLRPTDRQSRTGIYMGAATDGPGFHRLDFDLPLPLPSAQEMQLPRSQARSMAAQDAVRTILQRQGFVVRDVFKGYSSTLVNFVCTHPASNNLYFILTRWVDRGWVDLTSRNEFFQLSNGWFELQFRSRRRSIDDVWGPVKEAMEQQRLVRLLGGIHGGPDPSYATVYFVKMGSTDYRPL